MRKYSIFFLLFTFSSVVPLSACSEGSIVRIANVRHGISTEFETSDLESTKKSIAALKDVVSELEKDGTLFFEYKTDNPSVSPAMYILPVHYNLTRNQGYSLNKARAKAFVDLGTHIVDKRCDKFFDDLIRLQKDSAAVKSGINVTGTAISGVLSAVQASAKSIAMIALGTGFMEEGVDVFNGAILFNLKAEETRALVKKSQRKFLISHPLPSEYPNMIDAIKIVQGYAGTCLPAAISGYVSDAIRYANVKSEEEMESGSEKDELLMTVSDGLGSKKPLTEQQLAALYHYSIKGNGTVLTTEAGALTADLGDVKGLYDKMAPANRVAVRQALRKLARLDPSIREWSAEETEKTVQAAPSAAASPAAAPPAAALSFQPSIPNLPQVAPSAR